MRRRQLAGIFAAGAKGEMGTRRLMQRTQIVDLFLAVAEMEEFGAGRFGNHLQGIGPLALEKTRVLHSVSKLDAIRGLTQRRKTVRVRGSTQTKPPSAKQIGELALADLSSTRCRSTA